MSTFFFLTPKLLGIVAKMWVHDLIFSFNIRFLKMCVRDNNPNIEGSLKKNDLVKTEKR